MTSPRMHLSPADLDRMTFRRLYEAHVALDAIEELQRIADDAAAKERR